MFIAWLFSSYAIFFCTFSSFHPFFSAISFANSACAEVIRSFSSLPLTPLTNSHFTTSGTSLLCSSAIFLYLSFFFSLISLHAVEHAALLSLKLAPIPHSPLAGIPGCSSWNLGAYSLMKTA